MDIYTDAHIHLANIYEIDPAFAWLKETDCLICADSHSPGEYAVQESFACLFPSRIVSCYGIHPQGPDRTFVPFLERLLREDRIQAVGETGFDLFTEEYASHIAEQEEMWNIQIELAVYYGKPVVIHTRHALDRIFRDVAKLKKLPAVIFHSWPGSPVEAESILKRGINGFFSAGKGLLQNNKRMIRCVMSIPSGRLLLETDAPFQTLKGQKWTPPCDIRDVYKTAALLLDMEVSLLCTRIRENFRSAFCL